MSGLYIHIPFCKSKCSYCDFYSIANNSFIPNYLKMLLREIELRKNEIDNKTIETIYFGGGTPSILRVAVVNAIIEQIIKYYKISGSAEISFEANPEDLNKLYLTELKKSGINRLSIGLQSTDDETLKMMRRRHNVVEAINSVYNAFETGFENISVDFIYGIEGISYESFVNQLRKIVNLPVKHISAYHLSVEKGTLLYRKLNEGRFAIMNETSSYDQYCKLLDITSEKGFFQYEISNFAKNGFISRHNSSYWTRKEYLGFGPSAHSFVKNVRTSNYADVTDYIKSMNKGEYSQNTDLLTRDDIINESIMLGLRTVKGIDLIQFQNLFGLQEYNSLLEKLKIINKKSYVISNGFLKLSRNGMFVSDNIISKLFK